MMIIIATPAVHILMQLVKLIPFNSMKYSTDLKNAVLVILKYSRYKAFISYLIHDEHISDIRRK